MLTSVQTKVAAAKGGSFLIDDLQAQDVFTPEDFSDEQIAYRQNLPRIRDQ